MSTSNLKPLTRDILAIAALPEYREMKKTKAGQKHRRHLASRLRTLRETVGHKEARFKLRWGTYW